MLENVSDEVMLEPKINRHSLRMFVCVRVCVHERSLKKLKCTHGHTHTHEIICTF